MSNEPDWVEALETIYNEDLVWPADADFDSDHPVISAVGRDAEVVQDCLAFLSQSGLIGRVHVGVGAEVPRPGKEGIMGIPEQARRKGTHFGLTKMGFSVMHQRRMQERRDKREDQRIERQEENENQRAERQHEVNRAIAFLTLGLMTIAVIDSAVRAFVGASVYDKAFQAVYASIVFLFAFIIILNYFGLLSPLSTE